jgi:hypothetical protein
MNAGIDYTEIEINQNNTALKKPEKASFLMELHSTTVTGK